MLEGGPRRRGIVDPEDQRVRTLSRELTHLGIVAVDGQRGVAGQRTHRRAPPLGDVLELAVAIELVAEEIAETDRLWFARARAPRAAPPRPPRRGPARPRVHRGASRRPRRPGSRRSCCAPGETVRGGCSLPSPRWWSCRSSPRSRRSRAEVLRPGGRSPPDRASRAAFRGRSSRRRPGPDVTNRRPPARRRSRRRAESEGAKQGGGYPSAHRSPGRVNFVSALPLKGEVRHPEGAYGASRFVNCGKGERCGAEAIGVVCVRAHSGAAVSVGLVRARTHSGEMVSGARHFLRRSF